ncbi:MAG: hypothetical protein HZB10_02720 [Candidatus Yonathbacteria bacterium]|nr:hypothetical protein [Candidatus Yonathbacteria bacterium]
MNFDSFPSPETKTHEKKQDESKRSRVAWRSKLTGYTGHGEFILEGEKKEKKSGVRQYEEHLAKASKRNPDLEHWLESEDEVKKNDQISELGALLHDEWREPRKKEDGTFEARLKKTKDEAWIKEHRADEVDIANTDYINLPEDWKGENKISADVAISEVYKAVENKQELDDAFVESASDAMHVKWLERNGGWAPPEQKLPYAELSEEEKEKDRAIIRKAIEIYQSGE